MRNKLKMLKFIALAAALISLASCNSSSGEKYLSFDDHHLLDGNILVKPVFNRGSDKEKMDGAIYINLDRSYVMESNCKIQAHISSENMDLERSRLSCDTNNNTCFFNTGDFQKNPRMVLQVRDAAVSEISLNVSVMDKPENDEPNCIARKYELLLLPELKKPKFWEQVLAR